MAIGEINNGLSGGQDAMRKVAEHSDNVHTTLSNVGGRLLKFAEIIEGIGKSLAEMHESEEMVSARDSGSIAHEEAQTALRAVGSKLEGATNPQAATITRFLGSLTEMADVTNRNVTQAARVADDYTYSYLADAATTLREVAADYFDATAREASMQAELARTTAEEMGKYAV